MRLLGDSPLSDQLISQMAANSARETTEMWTHTMILCAIIIAAAILLKRPLQKWIDRLLNPPKSQ